MVTRIKVVIDNDAYEVLKLRATSMMGRQVNPEHELTARDYTEMSVAFLNGGEITERQYGIFFSQTYFLRQVNGMHQSIMPTSTVRQAELDENNVVIKAFEKSSKTFGWQVIT
ncbi:hypothetical protein [Vibrio vulnificus]|uniref:hypothetical protein n=1 Tax=Vibrio vulnificus TaxID=672 RepID=UPI001EEB5123|nr:hypothetical protein [Vibrio vulnificus]MCG6299905.1 hypothetical protein [Vibrio vulnificus]